MLRGSFSKLSRHSGLRLAHELRLIIVFTPVGFEWELDANDFELNQALKIYSRSVSHRVSRKLPNSTIVRTKAQFERLGDTFMTNWEDGTKYLSYDSHCSVT